MSWSIGKVIGEPERVRAVVGPQFDAAARYYEGKGGVSAEEQVDILNAKGQVMAFLDHAPKGHAVEVEANGSRGEGWLSVSVKCSAVKLA